MNKKNNNDLSIFFYNQRGPQKTVIFISNIHGTNHLINQQENTLINQCNVEC